MRPVGWSEPCIRSTVLDLDHSGIKNFSFDLELVDGRFWAPAQFSKERAAVDQGAVGCRLRTPIFQQCRL